MAVQAPSPDLLPIPEVDGIALNMVIRQYPFSVTFDAWALLMGSILLLLGMHWLQRSLLEGLILTVPIVLLIRNDYLNFLLLALGARPQPSEVTHVSPGSASSPCETCTRLRFRTGPNPLLPASSKSCRTVPAPGLSWLGWLHKDN